MPNAVLQVPEIMRHSHVYEQPPLRSVKLGPMALAGVAVVIITAVSAVTATTTVQKLLVISAFVDIVAFSSRKSFDACMLLVPYRKCV
jgi:hypothetical protein